MTFDPAIDYSSRLTLDAVLQPNTIRLPDEYEVTLQTGRASMGPSTTREV
jgi:hypothetical protein